MQKAIKVVAYNPITEEELYFSCKAQCAKYFGLKTNTVLGWFILKSTYGNNFPGL